jgi:hypothetical protein
MPALTQRREYWSGSWIGTKIQTNKPSNRTLRDANTKLKVDPARAALSPIPAGAPSGAAATSHKAAGSVEAQGK